MLLANCSSYSYVSDLLGVAALMAGRGALIKPWLFYEWANRKSYHPSAEERVAIYWRLATYFKVNI
jgi:tRNA-dihydrouridine synthase 3